MIQNEQSRLFRCERFRWIPWTDHRLKKHASSCNLDFFCFPRNHGRCKLFHLVVKLLLFVMPRSCSQLRRAPTVKKKLAIYYCKDNLSATPLRQIYAVMLLFDHLPRVQRPCSTGRDLIWITWTVLNVLKWGFPLTVNKVYAPVSWGTAKFSKKKKRHAYPNALSVNERMLLRGKARRSASSVSLISRFSSLTITYFKIAFGCLPFQERNPKCPQE